MGWWDCGIMGGDTPYDVAGGLSKKLGLDDGKDVDEHFPMHMPDAWTKREAEQAREALDKYGAEKAADEMLAEWKVPGDSQDGCVLFQVLGLLVISSGAELTPTMATKVIEAAEIDPWSHEEGEDDRRTAMEEFLAKVRAYDGKQSTIRQKGLLEKIAEHTEPEQ